MDLKEFLSSRVEIPDYFVIGKISSRPNDLGCVEINNAWYVYRVDDRGGCSFTGPFNDKAIIYACALRLHVAEQFAEYEFSDEEADIFMDTHLRYEEI